jgi:malate synthase
VTNTIHRERLQIATQLHDFVERRALPGTGVASDTFWAGVADILTRFVPANRALLVKRDDLQAQIDAWHIARKGQPIDAAAYQAFLREIGYLVPEPAPFQITTTNVDAEIATMAGPQLVVPSLNDRFVLNAANARWGSLYDAFYGTDALDAAPANPGGYDQVRGNAVVARVRAFLNGTIPGWEAALAGGAHPALAGRREGGLLFKNNGLHIEIVIDPASAVGGSDPLGIADVILEAALTTIVDLEDSVAAVDAEDKVAAYTNWLGLMRGDLTASFEKGGRTMTR